MKLFIIKQLLILIQEGWLARIVGYRIRTDTDISEVKTREGDYVASQLEDTINTPERNAIIVASYMEICGTSKAIAFCAGVEHANDLASSFRQASINAEVIVGSLLQMNVNKYFGVLLPVKQEYWLTLAFLLKVLMNRL
jgi:superfamily II DNA or RNA helicase